MVWKTIEILEKLQIQSFKKENFPVHIFHFALPGLGKKQNSNALMETFYQQSEIRRCRKPYYVNHTSLSGCGLYLLYHVFDEESKGGKKRLFLEYRP